MSEDYVWTCPKCKWNSQQALEVSDVKEMAIKISKVIEGICPRCGEYTQAEGGYRFRLRQDMEQLRMALCQVLQPIFGPIVRWLDRFIKRFKS